MADMDWIKEAAVIKEEHFHLIIMRLCLCLLTGRKKTERL